MTLEQAIAARIKQVWNPESSVILIGVSTKDGILVKACASSILIKTIEHVTHSCLKRDSRVNQTTVRHCLHIFTEFINSRTNPYKDCYYGAFPLVIGVNHISNIIIYALGDEVTLNKPDGLVLSEAITASSEIIKNYYGQQT